MEIDAIRMVAEYQEANKETALITVISSENVKGCNVGAMMLVDEQGTVLAGNIGDEYIQKIASEQGKICISRGLSRKSLLNIGEHTIEIFINVFCYQDHLIIAGAGTVALNIYTFAKMLGYHIVIADNRPEKLTKERFPEADSLLLGDIAAQVSSCTITENTNIVIATNHHEFDEQVLRSVISSPARYIGVLGNGRRVAGYFKNLEPLHLSPELLNRVYSPIGLNLGGKRTAEIALAVVAEMQAVKYHRSGGFLSKSKQDVAFTPAT